MWRRVLGDNDRWMPEKAEGATTVGVSSSSTRVFTDDLAKDGRRRDERTQQIDTIFVRSCASIVVCTSSDGTK